MTNLFNSLVAGATVAVGVVIDEKSLVPIGSVAAVCGVMFWLGRKVQKFDDRLEQIENKLKKCPMNKDENCALNGVEAEHE